MFKTIIFAIFLLIAVTFAAPSFSGQWSRFSSDFNGNCQQLTVQIVSESNSTYSIVDSSSGATLIDSMDFESDGTFIGNAITVLKNGKVITSACKGSLSNPVSLEVNVLPTVWFSGSTFYYNKISC